MPSEVRIVRADRHRVSELRPVFLALHEHHRQLSALPLTEPDERAWSERVSTYARHFDAGTAILHLAEHADRCVGYAFTVLHDGSDDTFPLGPRHAELYTLAVLPTWRGAGVGGALLDAVDAVLAADGVTALTVAVMVENEQAIRFYRRRGLVPGEVVLYRYRHPGGRPAG